MHIVYMFIRKNYFQTIRKTIQLNLNTVRKEEEKDARTCRGHTPLSKCIQRTFTHVEAIINNHFDA